MEKTSLLVKLSLYVLQDAVCICRVLLAREGAWGSVVVKALQRKSEGLRIDPRWCRWGFFPRQLTEPCALGLTRPLKMSTRKTPGDEGGRCVRVTTLPPSSYRISRRSRSLNLLEPQEPHQAFSGKPLPFTSNRTRQSCFALSAW
jgi:hypothetical protein